MFYEKHGITTYINAHDTYTIYGGSKMAAETLEAMRQAAGSFVDTHQMQRALSKKIAKMTRNEAAFFTNGAAGGIILAAAVCMARGDRAAFARLPKSKGLANEIILMRCQRNAYDTNLRTAGARIVEIGDALGTKDWELEAAITEKTAAVFFFAASHFQRAALPLEKVIKIAHMRGVPVIVDAAAQLPPVENFWAYTEAGADLVLFSGGKNIRGPQDSGLILGRSDLIDDCHKFGAPGHGVCRGNKTSREAMAGLFTALEIFMNTDHKAEYEKMKKRALALGDVMVSLGMETELSPHGPVGQFYPLIYGKCTEPGRAKAIAAEMKARRIYIGVDEYENRIWISPLNITDKEADVVAKELRGVVGK